MLGSEQPLGKLARFPLKFIPKSTVIRTIRGPNRGLKWVVGSGQHGCWIGSYEQLQVGSVLSAVEPGMSVFDVGAHAGYYTLMFSRAVGRSGSVIAFEASPDNARNLRRHLKINNITNVRVIEAAVCDATGEAKFRADGYVGMLSSDGAPVKTVRLDDFPTPDLIKMDIEGAETAALKGATRILSEKRTKMFVAIHEGAPQVECPALIERAGYSVKWLTGGELWALPHHVVKPPSAAADTAVLKAVSRFV